MWKGVNILWRERLQRSRDRRQQRTEDDTADSFATPSIQITSTVVAALDATVSDSLAVRNPSAANHNKNPENMEAVTRTHGNMDRCQASCPLVNTLAKLWAWPAVTFRIQTHPHEVDVSFCDDAGDTVLHWACFGNPPIEPISALLSVCPALAATRNAKGLLPLHVACSYRASSNVIRALMAAYPEGAQIQTRAGGSNPLHLLCDYGCSVDAIRAILESEAGIDSVLQEDNTFCRKPLYILLARRNLAQFNRAIADLRNQLRQRQQQNHITVTNTSTRSLQSTASSSSSSSSSNNQDHHLFGMDTQNLTTNWPDMVPQALHEFWQKAALLVLAEHYILRRSSGNKDAPPPIDLSDHYSHVLHGCVAMPRCPPSLIEFALLLHPEQMLVPDEDGRLPLHIAASKLYQDPSAKSVLIDLVTACPEAAQHRDRQQNIPLQLCGASAWNESLARLVLAYPLGLASMDFDDTLYPRIWARITLRRYADTTNVLFQLIRENPTIFARCTK